MHNMRKRSVAFLLCVLLISSLFGSAVFADEHEHSYSEVRVKEPTCTEAGLEANICGCGDYKDVTVLEPLGHEWGEGFVVTEPTADTVGVMGFYCTSCGEGRAEYIPVLVKNEESEAASFPEEDEDELPESDPTEADDILNECEAGSFRSDVAVPEGTQLFVQDAVPSVGSVWMIQNFIQNYMKVSAPEEIAVTACTVALVTPEGDISSASADVTLKTALPLGNAGVKDMVAVYVSEDGIQHVYPAEAAIDGGWITSVSFRAPQAAVYLICYALEMPEA